MSSPVEEHFICNKCKYPRPLSGGCDAFPEDMPFGVLFQNCKPGKRMTLYLRLQKHNTHHTLNKSIANYKSL